MNSISTVQISLYTVQSIMYTVQSTLYTVQSTLYTVQSTLYTVQSTLYTVQGSHHNIHIPLYIAQSHMPYNKLFFLADKWMHLWNVLRSSAAVDFKNPISVLKNTK